MLKLNYSLFLIVSFTLFNLNAQLNYSWTSDLEGASFSETFNVKVDNNGNVYQVGGFQGSVSLDDSGDNDFTAVNGTDIFFVKYNSVGEILFAHHFGSVGTSNGVPIAVDSQGNSYLGGHFSSTINCLTR